MANLQKPVDQSNAAPQPEDFDEADGHAWGFRRFASESAEPANPSTPARPKGCCT